MDRTLRWTTTTTARQNTMLGELQLQLLIAQLADRGAHHAKYTCQRAGSSGISVVMDLMVQVDARGGRGGKNGQKDHTLQVNYQRSTSIEGGKMIKLTNFQVWACSCSSIGVIIILVLFPSVESRYDELRGG